MDGAAQTGSVTLGESLLFSEPWLRACLMTVSAPDSTPGEDKNQVGMSLTTGVKTQLSRKVV